MKYDASAKTTVGNILTRWSLYGINNTKICLNVSIEGSTMLEIKKSFRDVDNVLYDWTDSPTSDYCAWRGITCDNVTFNVVALWVSLDTKLLINLLRLYCRWITINLYDFSNLSGLNLDGEISPAIGKLQSLVSM